MRRTSIGEVDFALNRLRNQRIGVCSACGCSRAGSRRAPRTSTSADQTAFLDRLLMAKLDERDRARCRRPRNSPDEGLQGVHARRRGPAAPDYELVAEAEAFFRANGVGDNFQIIGVGGVEVKRHGAAERQAAQARRHGHDRADALRRRLLLADLPHAGGRRARVPSSAGAHALWRESRWKAGIAAVRDGVTAADIAQGRERRVSHARAWGAPPPASTPACAAMAWACSPIQAAHPGGRHDTGSSTGMALIVHPNTYHPVVGYMVLGDGVVVTTTAASADRHAARAVQRRLRATPCAAA